MAKDLSNLGLKKISRSVPELTDIHKYSTIILDNNEIAKIEQLDACPNLQQLSIANNRIIRMTGVSKLRNLCVLNIPSNSIQAIEGLKDLLQLEWLNLSGNNIKSMDNLSACLKMKHLDLSDNSISVISNISLLTSLKTLLLHGNILTTLRGVPAYLPTSLSTLSLAENEITDLTEMSYLCCLNGLEQLSIKNNPAVLMTSTIGFDYRPYVVNWCMTLQILDGAVIIQRESLKAEWLYSQGKGRSFHPGQHKDVCLYLSRVCPLTTASETQLKEDKKLVKILNKQQQYKKQLLEESIASSPTPSVTSSKASRSRSPQKGNRHSPSPPSTKRMTVWSDDAQHDIQKWVLSDRIKEPESDIVLEDLEDSAWKNSLLKSNSMYLPFSTELPSAAVNLDDFRPSTAPPNSDFGGQNINNIHRPATVLGSNANPIDKVGITDHQNANTNYDNENDSQFYLCNTPVNTEQEVNSYQAYENKRLVPPEQNTGVKKPKPQTSFSPEISPKIGNSEPKKSTYKRSKSLNNKRIFKDNKVMEVFCQAELSKIREIALNRRKENDKMNANRATLLEDGKDLNSNCVVGTNVKTQQINTAEEVNAATRIQALWKGYRLRNGKGQHQKCEEIYHRRLLEHIDHLTHELNRVKKENEKERQLRVMHMSLLHALSSQVESLTTWKRTTELKLNAFEKEGNGANKRIDNLELDTKNNQLTAYQDFTCKFNSLQNQVEQMQQSMQSVTEMLQLIQNRDQPGHTGSVPAGHTDKTGQAPEKESKDTAEGKTSSKKPKSPKKSGQNYNKKDLPPKTGQQNTLNETKKSRQKSTVSCSSKDSIAKKESASIKKESVNPISSNESVGTAVSTKSVGCMSTSNNIPCSTNDNIGLHLSAESIGDKHSSGTKVLVVTKDPARTNVAANVSKCVDTKETAVIKESIGSKELAVDTEGPINDVCNNVSTGTKQAKHQRFFKDLLPQDFEVFGPPHKGTVDKNELKEDDSDEVVIVENYAKQSGVGTLHPSEENSQADVKSVCSNQRSENLDLTDSLEGNECKEEQTQDPFASDAVLKPKSLMENVSKNKNDGSEGDKEMLDAMTTPAPRNLSVRRISDTSLQLSWMVPLQDELHQCSILGYKLCITLNDDLMQEMSTTLTQALLGGLTVGCYRFCVKAISTFGDSEDSNVVIIQLKETQETNKNQEYNDKDDDQNPDGNSRKETSNDDEPLNGSDKKTVKETSNDEGKTTERNIDSEKGTHKDEETTSSSKAPLVVTSIQASSNSSLSYVSAISDISELCVTAEMSDSTVTETSELEVSNDSVHAEGIDSELSGNESGLLTKVQLDPDTSINECDEECLRSGQTDEKQPLKKHSMLKTSIVTPLLSQSSPSKSLEKTEVLLKKNHLVVDNETLKEETMNTSLESFSERSKSLNLEPTDYRKEESPVRSKPVSKIAANFGNLHNVLVQESDKTEKMFNMKNSDQNEEDHDSDKNDMKEATLSDVTGITFQMGRQPLDGQQPNRQEHNRQELDRSEDTMEQISRSKKHSEKHGPTISVQKSLKKQANSKTSGSGRPSYIPVSRSRSVSPNKGLHQTTSRITSVERQKSLQLRSPSPGSQIPISTRIIGKGITKSQSCTTISPKNQSASSILLGSQSHSVDLNTNQSNNKDIQSLSHLHFDTTPGHNNILKDNFNETNIFLVSGMEKSEVQGKYSDKATSSQQRKRKTEKLLLNLQQELCKSKVKS